jgi:autotransporter-associated beta strand protein
LDDARLLYLSQTAARFVGNDAAPTTETTGGLGVGTQVAVQSGASSLSLEPGANQDLTLMVSNITVQGASTIDFRVVPNGSGTATIATTNAAGILAGASATWNRSSWAKIAGGVVTGMTDGEYFTAFGNNASNAHVDVSAGATTVSSSDAEQTLRFNAAAGSTVTIGNGVTLKLHGLNGSATALRPGILMTPGSGPVTIASDGTGQIDQGLNQVLFIHQYSANALTLSARIGGAGSGNSIVKSGPGELILTATNNTMGGTDGTRVFGGTLTVDNLKDTGTACALGTDDTIVLANATLKYIGSGDTHNRYIAMRGPATLDASGSGPWNFSNSATVRRSSSWDNYLTLTGSGSGALLGTIDLLFGGLVKEGNGTWTICGTQSYLGNTTVNAGTLVLSNNCALARSVTVGSNGTLAGGGTIGEDLVLNGTRRMEVRGESDYDRLTVRYDATLGDGLIDVATVGGYKPTTGQQFAVVTAGGALSGTPTSTNPSFSVKQVGNSLVVQYTSRGMVILVR